MTLKENVIDAVQNPKLGAAVGAATAATGTFLDWLPDSVISKLAAILGILLTIVLIVVQVRKYRSLVLEEKIKSIQLEQILAPAEFQQVQQEVDQRERR